MDILQRYYDGFDDTQLTTEEVSIVDDMVKEIERLRKDGRCVVEAKEIYHKNWIDEKNKNEQLRKEKEWLLNESSWDKYFLDEERSLRKDYKQKIIDKMQQALKEKE
ncbi:hypothetical protein LCGC14_1861150 [marine sediment metagenome]|uniref:Uncharacterized protein n=1 Tax=marine sediment metagenome TaxID=412755 RepID=A0A0F9IM03_9ZZZZ|nr:hypothetical protein [Candidatus Aminicenantes bacterium]